MPSYDFLTLSGDEFERLVVSLLEAEWSTRIERFKPGKDGGIDGRFYRAGGTVILQAKHWFRSGWTVLESELRKVELAKVKRLTPARHVLATSVGLTPGNKQTVLELFDPYIAGTEDILGADDLNGLLELHPNVERAHYKLWLSSINILELLLNNAVIGRSQDELRLALSKAPRYVVTPAHGEAMRKLDQIHTVIITGEPGIGKTTLAQQICLELTKAGYEFYFIAYDFADAEKSFCDGKKQVFLFDDFLGRNYLDLIKQNIDSQVVSFARRVARDPAKRFVLTSRSTILNQADQLSDRFIIANADQWVIQVRIEQLLRLQKAQILYNHIWFSELCDAHRDAMYEDRRYRKVVDHKNFSPRIVEFISDSAKVNGIAADQYWAHVKGSLDNPQDIWAHPFNVQLDDNCRDLVVMVALNGGPIGETQLRASFDAILDARSQNKLGRTQAFDAAIRILVGGFLNRLIDARTAGVAFDLFNPSIGDFILSRLGKSTDELTAYFHALGTDKAIANLRKLGAAQKVSGVSRIAESLLVSAAQQAVGKNSAFVVATADLCSSLSNLPDDVSSLVAKLALEFDPNQMTKSVAPSAFSLLEFAYREHSSWEQTEIIETLGIRLLEQGVDTDVLEACRSLIFWIGNGPDSDLAVAFRQAALGYWTDAIGEDVANDSILDELLDYSEESRGVELVEEHAKYRLGMYDIEFTGQEIWQVAAQVDVQAAIRGNIERGRAQIERNDRWVKEDKPTGVGTDTEIDKLFQRDR